MQVDPNKPPVPNEGPGGFACNDPWTGEPMTRGTLFDQHAMTMLVIAEVLNRERKNVCETSSQSSPS